MSDTKEFIIGGQTVDFRFRLWQEVKIKAINVRGVVDALSYDYGVKMVRVSYWYDGNRRTDTMHESEVEA